MRSTALGLILLLVPACSAESYSPASPDHIEVVQGGGQRGVPGRVLDSLIIARVVDAGGDAIHGGEITWQVVGGGGSFDIPSGTPPADLAAGSWTLGLGPDRQRLLLSAAGVDPVVIEADAAVFGAIEFGVGYEFGCGLDEDRATWCWGEVPIGGSDAQNFKVPALIEGAPAFIHLAVGGDHACGLTAAGEVWCWGMNYSGQLGNGTTSPWPTNSPVPLKVPGLPTIVSIDATDRGTCALTTTGELWCWGATEGTAPRLSAAPLFVGTTFEQLAIGYNFGCGVVSGGQVACWGDNSSGQLGRGTVGGSSLTLLPISKTFVATALDAGDRGACAISSGRDLICWGEVTSIRGHGYGAPGSGTPTRSDEDSPALRVALGGFCGAVWQSPANPRLLCGSWPGDIEQLPSITAASFGGVGDLCLGVGTGGLYCKTYSDQSNGPPFDWRGTGVPAPEPPAP